MDNCTHHFKNTLTSFSHASFRLYIHISKNLLHYLRERENCPEANKLYKLFSHLNICLHYHIFIRLHITYEHVHLTPSSCSSVNYT